MRECLFNLRLKTKFLWSGHCLTNKVKINFDGSLDKLRQIDWVWFDKFVVYYYSTSSCCICQNLKMWYTTNKILFSLPPIFTTFQFLFNRFSNFLNNEFLSNLNTSICYISSGDIESVCIDILTSLQR